MATVSKTASTTSAVFLAYNSSRRGGVIRNTDANPVYILLGDGSASATNHSVMIASGAQYDLSHTFRGAVNGVWGTAGAGAALVTDW